MGHSSIAIYILVALMLARLLHGRPATNDGRSVLNMLESRVSKPEDFSESKAISSLVQENLSIPVKLRQRRLSDQRRAELETLVTLSNISDKRSLTTRGSWQLDPMRIGRRRRFAVDRALTELVSIKAKHIGDPAYPLIRPSDSVRQMKEHFVSRGMSLARKRGLSLNIPSLRDNYLGVSEVAENEDYIILQHGRCMKNM